ncbi:uncharacterized protein KY384_000682 [Bacidia gigantensis]|uniref:uncharacterized protein n=1 Tax=Bacidia gigantensis TaxID=2732470 RepID=UPI001D057A11|nr:uncharacterized protein KY384_000682 [Bacidia gigantensis]KAG8525920.1 hypothetical protein KY384_000682 [Bacidia gigantensis]
MIDSVPTRKSRRQRVPNKKYLDEDIETLNQVLSSDSDEAAEIAQSSLNAARGDIDFNTTAHDSPSDTDTSGSSVASSAVHTPVEEYEDAESYASDSDHEGPLPRFDLPSARFKPKQRWERQPSNVRSRGIEYNLSDQAKKSRLPLLSGPGNDFVAQVANAADLWGNDVTLPRKSDLRQASSLTAVPIQNEGMDEWRWYYELGGRDVFAQRQKSDVFSLNDRKYLPQRGESRLDVLLGPYGRQRMFSINTLQLLDIGEAWDQATHSGIEGNLQTLYQQQGRGWLLNAGGRVRSMDWAPNHEASAQYLAMSTKDCRSEGMPKEPPSFSAAARTRSCIQIWAFDRQSIPSQPGILASACYEPKLAQLLCHDWGDAKQLKWCPVPRKFSDEDRIRQNPVGLLGGVFDDGCTRVIDVALDARSTDPLIHREFQAPVKRKS